ncbi:hypothetical protein BGX27_006693 [Mortierella sp. AM989]|nr:hypothetical protein BGX27_006693 [Mortierella sp. AM989]
MLDSDSGSSDLSDASSLSSDNSSGSEADVFKDKPQSTALRNKQHLPLNHPALSSAYRASKHDASSLLASGSDHESDSNESLSLDDEGAHNQSNAPISLSASQPVYSQEIMDRSMMLLPANAKYNVRPQIPISSRGRGRGRGRALLSGHRSRKYDAASTTVIDFEDLSGAPEESIYTKELNSSKSSIPTSIPHASSTPNTVPKKKGTPVDPIKAKFPKVASGANNKQKSGSRKVGRPKSVSKDVYCICRGPYDGVEFMIACDRCEEWFHGRCIGMKPQAAKKSSHYYCDTCQKIRRMFGVVTTSEESLKPVKPKGQVKKSTEKHAEVHNLNVDMSSSDEKLPLLRIKAGLGSKVAQSYSVNVITSSNPLSGQATSESIPYQHVPQGPSHIQSKPPLPVSHDYHQPVKQKSGANEDKDAHYAARYNTPSTASANPVTIPPSYNNNSRPSDRVSQDDEDEDICPICDFECTCNTKSDTSVEITPPVAKPTPSEEDVHALTSIKVPFQPNLGLQSAHNLETENAERHRSFLNAEKRPVIRAEGSNTALGDTFHTSAKNPMSTPTSQRRLSVIKRGGKSIGKYPMKESKIQLIVRNRGKSIKSGKANIFMYNGPRIDSGSEISNEFSEDEDQEEGLDSDQGEFPNSFGDMIHMRPHSRYESNSENDGADDIDGALSLSSSSSLSDIEEGSAPPMSDLYPRPKGGGKITIGKKWSRPQAPNSTGLSFEETSTAERSTAVKKRGPGRPKKIRDPLIVSLEDEMALYTPAVAARKLTATYPQKGEPDKPARATVKSKAGTELPFIAYDLGVAKDVMALNALGSDSEGHDIEAKSNSATPQVGGSRSETFSEDDIFGDGDLSDELSGDLSDILSEDFDDLSGESSDFSSSDEEDETGSSSPREFNYSEMEEQDESLVDSDSSINSMPSDSSDSSDPESESALDDDDEVIVYGHEGSEESIDEEELLILEEQERLILAKAHSLRDVFSEEDSDPDRNPFESSEEEIEEEEDERVFDGDDDDFYSEEYYEDDYQDDEYDGMDEQEILAQLKGVQADIQALMMIPPEQQEQLLLLQHYEEAHRQQQEQLQTPHDQFQNQGLDSQQGTQMVNLLETSSFLPPYDINVPDLDAVSEQLAASLADSIAKSMAGAKQAMEGTLLSEAGIDEDTSVQPADTLGTESSVGVPLNVSPRSASSLSPGTSDLPWSALIPSSPNSLDSNSTSIPTPANTPTPPGTTVGVSPSLPGPSWSQVPIPSGGSSTGLAQKQQVPQGKIQSLSNNPTYKPLTSVAVSTIGGRAIQPILPRLAPGESLAGLSTFARIQEAGSKTFKEAAQKALGGLGKSVIPESNLGSVDAPKDGLDSGDTTDDASPDMNSTDLRKRKGEDMGVKETGKRRHLSIASSKGSPKNGTLSSVPTPESEVSLPSSSLNSPPVSSMSVESMSPFDVTAASSSADSPSSYSVTPTMELSPTMVYDFSKASMPFVGPSARIFSSADIQKRASASQPLRMRKNSLKGKESRQQADAMPMDDLLDTSALYDRSSSRSPSPGRTGAGEEGDSEISQSMLKDLNRWERVPIGTFRRSRRPSSPYVGLQGALKFGNVTMPATLLADHQQHQQQLFQQPHRLHKRPPGARKQRNPSFLVSDVGGQGSRSEDLGHLLQGDKQQDILRRKRRSGSTSSSHVPRPGGRGGLHIPSSRRISKSTSSGLSADLHAGLGLGVGLSGLADSGLTMDSSSTSKNRTGSSSGVGVGIGTDNTKTGLEDLKDLMTDSSQLPSSACPTPLHSPLFSATAAGSRVLHHSSGEPVVISDNQNIGKMDGLGNGIGARGEESIVSHLELDIGKEMDGFHERLLAKTRAESGGK